MIAASDNMQSTTHRKEFTMSNRIYIESVQVSYLRYEPLPSRDSYGLFVWDDYEHFHLLDFQKQADIPSTLEAILEYCLKAGYSQVWDMLVQNTADGICVFLDEDYFEPADVRRLMDAVEKRHKETHKEE